MAKKIVTEVLEIEAGAVTNALRADRWPISAIEKVEALDVNGKVLGEFGGLRFTYVTEEPVRQNREGGK